MLVLPSPKSASKVVASRCVMFSLGFSVAFLGQYSWAPGALVCGPLNRILSLL